MTLDDLIERLEEQRMELGGDTEVRLMTQENWPFENRILGCVSSVEMQQADCEDDEEGGEPEDGEAAGEAVVYLVEGGQLCYGSKRAWECVR